MAPERAAALGRQQLGHGLAGEVAADHGRPPQHRPLARAEQLQPGGQQGLDGGRQLGLVLAPVLLAQGGGQLLQEQRVAGGDLEQPPAGLGRRPGQRPEQRAGVLLGQRAQLDPDARRPGGQAGRRSSSSGRARQTSSIPCLAWVATASVRSRKVGSAQCRSSRTTTSGRRRASVSSSRRVAQKISGAASVPGPWFPRAERPGQPLGHPGRVGLAVQQRLQLLAGPLRRPGLGDQLAQGPEGDAVAVGQAPARQHRRLGRGLGGQLVDQPGLADAGLAERGRQHRLAVPDRPGQPVAQPGQLLDPVDHRRVQADGQGPGPDGGRQQPEAAAAGRLDLQRGRGQAAGLVADQDLARRRPLGQLLGLADGVAGEARRLGAADQRLAGGQADPRGQGQPALLQGGGLGLQRPLGGQGRLGGPQGVVLVQGGDAEDPDDAPAGHRRQPPAVPLQGGAEDGLGPLEDVPERLRVEGRSRARSDLQLGAEHRHRLAGGHGGGDRRRRGRPQGRVVAEDGPLQLAQGWGRLQAELLQQQLPDLAVGLQGVGLAAGAVQGEHQLAAEPLAQRLLGDQALELADQLGPGAEGQVGLDPLLHADQPQLLQPGDLGLGERLVAEVGQGRPPPQGQRLGQGVGGLGGGPVGQGLATLGEQALEPAQVDLVGDGPEQVPGRPGDQPPLGQGPAQPRHGRLEGVGRPRGRVLAPQLHQHALAGHDLVGVQDQQGEHGPLAGSPVRDRPPAVRQLQRTQEANLHRSSRAASWCAPAAFSRPGRRGDNRPGHPLSASCQRPRAGSVPTAQGIHPPTKEEPCRSSRGRSCSGPCWPS